VGFFRGGMRVGFWWRGRGRGGGGVRGGRVREGKGG
jgi:hypothetical protein